MKTAGEPIIETFSANVHTVVHTVEESEIGNIVWEKGKEIIDFVTIKIFQRNNCESKAQADAFCKEDYRWDNEAHSGFVRFYQKPAVDFHRNSHKKTTMIAAGIKQPRNNLQ